VARVRENVWKLKASDKTLDWYERAITAMKAKPFSDPTSWRFQAAIHEYERDGDPFASPADDMPSKAEQKTYWNQCQHGSWFFLSWHRMYLHIFETIVTAEIVKQGGPSDWALPYWNYSDANDPNARLLPTAFRSAIKDDGSPNALYVPTRTVDCNAGRQFADDADIAIAGPLREPEFQSLEFGTGFGGPQTRFMHGGDLVGSVELTPHGTMHMAVGGWMQRFFTAALDPIFWLHHANIDRLWQVWLDRDSSHANPAATKWLTGVRFKFRDANGKAITMTSKQVADSTAAPLSYSYEETDDPLTHALAMVQPLTVASMKKKKSPPEMVGATRRSFSLNEDVTHATFAAKPKATARRALSAAAGPRRVFLNIEKVVSNEPAPSYDVYLNVPEGRDPKEYPHLFVGRLPMFGLAESSRKSAKTAGSGLHYALDITNLYAHMSSLPAWDPNNLRVSFVPARGHRPANVTVGRVSLYFE